MNNVTLITGGARSGKSSYALECAMAYGNRAFIATAVATDEEMTRRIALHREERGDAFRNIEEPLDLAGAVRSLPEDTEVAVIDCLTVWLGNLLHEGGPGFEERTELDDFLEVLEAPPCRLIVVTNELGMGIVPPDANTRRFRDMAGIINRKAALAADEVVFIVSGMPMFLKGSEQ